ncbi:stromal cell-derived factor 2-like protein [Carex littledalei]|uniref:Stromal cell-derived factor 2-like protein n=1 Tax=Carex littledalei TaxID=544730 RepID=A0A833QQ03_9POAL|nr:stromal cell-derived factor 2-like protein [Carex littledalei]
MLGPTLPFSSLDSSLAASRYSKSGNLSCIDLVSDRRSITIVASTQGPARRKSNWFLALLLIMAAGFFALAVFLYLGLELPNGSPSSAMAAEGVEVTYGSVIKLTHERTKFRLHSHDVPYGSGSGQQSVTGFQGVDDSNSYWVVRPVPDTSAKQGDAITHGTVIRFQHMRTRKWLHSHLHASPISGNLEVCFVYSIFPYISFYLDIFYLLFCLFQVSCFGSEHQSDTGDHWRLEIDGSGKTWRQDQKVRLRHVDTQGYLHSHDKKYSRIAGGQQEVCGVREKRADNVWLATEGVYLPLNNSK